MHNLSFFIDEVEGIIKRHQADDNGHYYQKLFGEEEKNNMPSIYGCANAVSLLYTIGSLPEKGPDRDVLIHALQAYQDRDTGLFYNEGNYSTHTTAFLAGALDLLDSKCLSRAKFFEIYNSKSAIEQFMDSIDWEENPWLGAHLGSGIYASMILTDTAMDEWQDWYFDWLDKNIDTKTGLWKKDTCFRAPAFHYAAAAFHYVFNYEYAKRTIPCAEAMQKTFIDGYMSGEYKTSFDGIGWPYIDYTYTIVCLQKHTGKYKEETMGIVKELADKLVNLIEKEDVKKSNVLNNLNLLLAIISALAVMQDMLPDYIITPRPLKLVLDKRPFI